MKTLGIDIGGTGIKAAIVENGELVTDRFRVDTPQPATPKAVAHTVQTVCSHFQWSGPIGCAFPSVIQNGIAKTAANIDQGWVDCAVDRLLAEHTSCPVVVLNDADAAGLAEIRFGSMDYHPYRSIMFVTIGTGLGTALFRDGTLFPNTELGHLVLNGTKVEHYASRATKTREDLSWEEWGARFDEVLALYERLFWPDLFVLGGGNGKRFHKFSSYLHRSIPVVAASLHNDAGIIGAGVAAQSLS